MITRGPSYEECIREQVEDILARFDSHPVGPCGSGCLFCEAERQRPEWELKKWKASWERALQRT